jgi:hypothetical protein
MEEIGFDLSNKRAAEVGGSCERREPIQAALIRIKEETVAELESLSTRGPPHRLS